MPPEATRARLTIAGVVGVSGGGVSSAEEMEDVESEGEGDLWDLLRGAMVRGGDVAREFMLPKVMMKEQQGETW